MKRLILKKYHSFSLVEESTLNTLANTEVKIKTAFAGLSYTDIIIKRGWYAYQQKHMPLPYTPGFEASGRVIAVGKEVTSVKPGDKVVVMQRSGCFAYEIVTDEKSVIVLPDHYDLAYAASLPVNFFTAWHALNNIVVIFPNSRVLVTSAAGGVGGMLVQLSSHDHEVTAVVGSEEKIAYVKKLGAQEAYTYQNMLSSNTFDVIFCATGENMRRYKDMLAPGGKLIVYGFHALVPTGVAKIFNSLKKYLILPKVDMLAMVYNNQTFVGFNIIQLSTDSPSYKRAREAFSALLHSKQLEHSITIFPVEKYAEAFLKLEDRSSKGKILLSFE
jgi:synaptic vesicle membrane protein VAT-1